VSFITVENVIKRYDTGYVSVEALKDVSFEVEKGELAVIVGHSGSGKTTLLNLLGGMDTCTDGKITVDGEIVSEFDNKQLVMYRRKYIGFVFQFYNLINNLTARENVELSSQLLKDSMNADEILEKVGLGDRMDNFPAQLSGGEQQRVAIARAVAKKPALLLCDEPTGALDYKTGKLILKLLQNLSREIGMTVLIVTHNSALTPMADRVIRMRSGCIEAVTVNDNPTDVENIEW
jgi:putative ABC transport system ATP-binding protein